MNSSSTPSSTPQPLSYEAAVDYLFGRINYERVATSKYTTADFQLRRMSTLLERLGNPHLKIPAVHITGTKGKGSTASMTASILREAGFRVGLFTSPHLERFEERMTVNGDMPSRRVIVELVRELRELARDLESGDDTRPTFFELSTALAWMVFTRSNCDVVVLEVGLGGRLDTTNLCRSVVTAITSISRDHMRLLGDTLESIAREKAGIIKPGVPCLTAVDQPSVLAVIESVCLERQSSLWKLGSEIEITQSRQVASPDGIPHWQIDLTYADRCLSEITIPLAGEYQTRNAALAITAADLAIPHLSSHATILSDETIRHGLAQVAWPLRMEVAGQAPLIVLDAAHNDASMSELCQAVQSIPAGQRTLIFGTSRDKEAAAMLRIAATGFDEIIITRYSTNPRAWPVVELLQLARQQSGVMLRTCDTVHEALQVAREQSGPQDMICVAGSFFLAAEARAILKP